MVSLDVIEVRDKWGDKFEYEHYIVTFMEIHFFILYKKLFFLFLVLSLFQNKVHV